MGAEIIVQEEMTRPLLIRGARVWCSDEDEDLPPIRDVVIENGKIASLTGTDEQTKLKQALIVDSSRGQADVIDARHKLVVPGFVNAHFHSYDVLAKGLIEDAPFDVWALQTQPAYYGERSKDEIRLRTILGGIECLKSGITTVQDMCTLVPQDEDTLDVIAAAYRELGIRVVFSIALRDVAELDIAPFMDAQLTGEARALVEGHPRDPIADLRFVESQLARYRSFSPRWHWAVSASGPQRSSQRLLEGVADISQRHDLPIFTHVYETKAQTAKARVRYRSTGGSMIRHLAEMGFLTARTNLVHGVWLSPSEIELIARHDSGVVLNPMSNMKLKSGIAPIHRLHSAGVRLAIGCDNCSCGDCQNIFQAMKLSCLLPAVSDINPTGVLASHAMHAATTGGARAVGLHDQIGSIRPGARADLAILDLTDVAFLPLNSVVRQLVFSETGRSVETTIVDGRVLMHRRKVTTVDEISFRVELESMMPAFRRDFERIKRSSAALVPHLLQANRRLSLQDVGVNRTLE